ncbi:MAG: heme-binding domain-containing protein [Actinomycetota bacterium]|nr:heme-binding domain-containing protein [Actinomycetota bacterium]
MAAQLVPYGWQKPNPPVTADAPWPAGPGGRLARRACYDCHSNETDWPAYSERELNLSTWDRDDDEADDAAESVVEGSMPPARFTLAHPGRACPRRRSGSWSRRWRPWRRPRKATRAEGTRPPWPRRPEAATRGQSS